MPYPSGLHVLERLPTGGWGDYRGPVVVLVHGSLDRAASFGRTLRRLEDLAVVAYDRRGYQGSRQPGPVPVFADHVRDLLGVMAALPPGHPVTVVGHSLGGDVVIGAAIAEPWRFASIGAYEPPMPWLGFRRSPAAPAAPAPDDVDPDREVERFFRRMVGDTAWDRLPEGARASRRADGPAVVADLSTIRGPAPPFDISDLRVPALIGRGGPASEPHHRAAAAWLAEQVPGAALFEIEGAGHGAHLSHPDAFAAMVRRAVAMGGAAIPDVGERPEDALR